MSTVNIHPRVVDSVVYEESGITFEDFTDNTDATGEYACGFTLPVGFFIERCWLTGVVGFEGSTTATVQIGDGDDVDRLSTGTPSVFADATALDLGVPSGVKLIATAFKPVITITEDSDWGDVAAGELNIHVAGYMV